MTAPTPPPTAPKADPEVFAIPTPAQPDSTLDRTDAAPPRGRFLRKLLIFAVVVLVLAGVLRFFLPGIVRSTIESRASHALGQPVKIDRLTLSVTGARLSMEGVSVAAHEDIGGRDALTIGLLSLDLSWRSLMQRRFEIENLELRDVDFLALRNEGGDRNIGPALLRLRGKKEKKPSTPIAQAEVAERPVQASPRRSESPRAEKPRGEVWTVDIRKADISNINLTVRSEGEPHRQEGEATASLGSLTIRDLAWPSTGSSGTISVSDFKFDGIGGRWEGNRILSLDNANVTVSIKPDLLMIEDAIIEKPLYRQSWDHLMRYQISRTEDLLNLVFSPFDDDFADKGDSEEEQEAAAIEEQFAESGPLEAPLLGEDEVPIDEVVEVSTARKESEERPRFKMEVRRLRIVDGDWIRQTRINGTWTDVVTTFGLELDREGEVTDTRVFGASNYENSEFEVSYQVDEDEDRTIGIRARQMPFHQMFWGETIKDERIPRVEHTLYDLDIDVTHHKGVLRGHGLAAFSEVRITPDRRPFWQRISLKGGGWATILSELADPETGNSQPVPFEVERPLSEFNIFVLYTELQAAFDLARLALSGPIDGIPE